LTLEFLVVKLHWPGPPDITRHGATSANPLFSIVMSMAAHFCAVAGTLARNSSAHAKSGFVMSRPLCASRKRCNKACATAPAKSDGNRAERQRDKG
jgi:hypothetical protein